MKYNPLSDVLPQKNLNRGVNLVDEDVQPVDQLDDLDSVCLDMAASYERTWEDLCTWYPKVRIGGIIGGSHYDSVSFPEATRAIEQFFRRFDWKVHQTGEGDWWVEKQPLHISFIMPAYNCAGTIAESVESIMNGNFESGDDLLIVDDASTDRTPEVLAKLQRQYPAIQMLRNPRNKGGGATRNTAVEACRHSLIFCLDSDNLLASGSVPELKKFLERTGADVAYFEQIHYFTDSINDISHKWMFPKQVTLADCLASINPGASGNYMFTVASWLRASGYPEFAGALDTWGFGLRQLATNCKMYGMPNSFYYHRHGHDSYWIRDTRDRRKSVSLRATQLLIPYFDLIMDEDIDYIMGEGRYTWFFDLNERPVRLQSGQKPQKLWEAEGGETAS